MSTACDRVRYDRDRMPSCIYGLAVGDALGVPYEFRGRGAFECTGMVDGGTHGRYAGTWSDDTSMAPCICSSVKRLGTIDTADIAYRFRRWPEHGGCTCGGRIDFHAGHVPDGRVSICGKGEPLPREAGYRRGNCDSTTVSIGKCEPEGVGHD